MPITKDAPKLENQAANQPTKSRLVSGPDLLEQLFCEDCRPSIRWLRQRVAEHTIPFCRVGRLCFFDPDLVREHFAAKAAANLRPALRQRTKAA
ncbi:MAG TPA: hypothetical protein VMJ12_02865 [Candidatus Acidoferrales bacterium]|nr:hypothetical protein [Candidatus Acidoferrales bacterium]